MQKQLSLSGDICFCEWFGGD